MTETQAEPLGAVASKLDDDGSNPFWPKGVGTPGQPDNPDSVTINGITFDQTDSAKIALTVTTKPPGQAWTVNWGDGTADQPIAAGTGSATHTYADKSSGKKYTVSATCLADTDTRNLQY